MRSDSRRPHREILPRLRGVLPSRIRCSAEGTQSRHELSVGPAAWICGTPNFADWSTFKDLSV